MDSGSFCVVSGEGRTHSLERMTFEKWVQNEKVRARHTARRAPLGRAGCGHLHTCSYKAPNSHGTDKSGRTVVQKSILAR